MITEDLTAFLLADAGVSALVGSSVFPRRLPQESAFPALTVHQISQDRAYAHGTSGLTVTSRLQINAITKTAHENNDLVEAVIAALDGHSGVMGGTTVNGVFIDDIGELAADDEFDELGDYAQYIDVTLQWEV